MINDLSAISTIIMISHDKDVIKNCKNNIKLKIINYYKLFKRKGFLTIFLR